MFKKALLILGLLSLAGCKLHVIALKGGEVQSPTGAGTCLENTNCFHDIVDTTFNESFEAKPASGYEFVKWYSGEKFLCGNSTNPVCPVNSGILTGLVSDAQIVAADDYYIMPVFKQGAPITDTVMADDGNEWVQPILFAGVSHAELAAACPGGVCSGVLNGNIVDGWNWASGSMVATLFNAYWGLACSFPCASLTSNTDFFEEMLDDGFVLTRPPPRMSIDGYTSDNFNTSYAGVAKTQGDDECAFLGCWVQAGVSNVDTYPLASLGAPEGAWLYR